MTTPDDRSGEMRVGELASQHASWVAARSRLWNGPPKAEAAPVTIAVPLGPVEPLVSWGAPINLIDRPSPRFLIRVAALRHGVRYGDVIGESRSKYVVAARDHAIRLIWTHCRLMSLPAVGRLFDRDHTTILHSLRKQGLHGDHFYSRRKELA